MISSTVLGILAEVVPESKILRGEPMKKHTTFRVGGEADCLILIRQEEQLASLIQYISRIELPYLVMGNGSNLLVSDSGYEGIVLKTTEMNAVRTEENCIIAQTGALLSQVAREACEQGLTGMEFAAGIPGTVGGAVVMNAGAYDGEMKQIVKQVNVLDRAGNRLEMDNETMEFGYRSSVIKGQPFTVTSVIFSLKPGNTKLIKEKMDELAALRRQKQPLEFPSAGSTFKRPEGYFAGKLIMDAGLRGFSIGGAAVSEKHCGFIINKANATAQDISELIDEVTEQVYTKFGVRLEPEVIRIGKF